MKRLLAVLCVAAVLMFVGRQFSAAPGATTVSAQERMKTFQLVLLKKGSAPMDKKLLDEHGAYMKKLGADGISVAAGPFTDGGEIVGAMILRDATVERAKEIEAADPGVKSGMFTVEVMPFMTVDEGQFQPWAKPFAQETMYFGFLKSGPNRGQDKEESARLQKEHLAYMDGQAKQGKLIVAGPFVEPGINRGIVIYRVESAEEAAARANADPMVKVGRLVVELHPWSIPRGALR